jgi:hypothetical protein
MPFGNVRCQAIGIASPSADYGAGAGRRLLVVHSLGRPGPEMGWLADRRLSAAPLAIPELVTSSWLMKFMIIIGSAEHS